MATAANTELVEKFEQFYRDYYRDEIGELARKFPNEKRSLYVDWQDLYRFDPDLADDYLSQPEQLREHAEEALRVYDLPVDVKLGGAHVRIRNLPEHTEIRDLRSQHVNNLVSIQGIVRKATDVRPKIQEAAFECQRCGTLTRVPQSESSYQEPHECQGCERQGPFRLNVDQSEFVDAQQVRVQESPEGLRGGETPRSMDVRIEDDLTGEVTPGDHVTVTGILRLEQGGGGNNQEQSPVFDTYVEGITVEIEEEQFEDMEITEADKKEIIELSNTDDLYDRMIGSIAPSIYGYEQQKLAIVLQLFSGVTKHLPDGTRIRGDLHMLLIGDPGTGKCQKFDTKVTLADGSERKLGALVEEHLDDPILVDDGVYQQVDIDVLSIENGTVNSKRATKVWKREAPERMYEIRTESGIELEVTPSHPLFGQVNGSPEPIRADELQEGQFVARPRQLRPEGDNSLDVTFQSVNTPNANPLTVPGELTPSLARLLGYIIGEGHVNGPDSTATVTITNEDEAVLSDAEDVLDTLGLRHNRQPHHTRDHVDVIRCSSSEFVRFLREIEPKTLETSEAQRVPDCIHRATPDIKGAFLKAYVEGEGSVSSKEREITVASMSRELLHGIRSLLLSLGIDSQIQSRHNGSYRLRISGEDFRQYTDDIGLVTDRKSVAVREHDGTRENTNTDVVPGVGETLRRVRETLRLTQHDCGIRRPTYQHYELGDRNPSRDSLRTVLERFEARIAELKTLRSRVRDGDWEVIKHAREELNVSQQSLSGGMDVTQTAISYYERNGVVPDGGEVDNARDVVLDRIESALAVESTVEELKGQIESDLRWDRIDSIELIDPDYDWVYDLEVEGTHNYVSNNLVSHNSQLLQYVQKISPRSVYTSGKGASSAGLTAAAVRDDFGDGQQWTLEAGALVLADQGIAAVDELDKMKCVTGDTLVSTIGDGPVPIEELADGADGSVERLDNGRTIRDVDCSVRTMTDDGRIVRRPVTAIHEYDAPERLLRVTLESGSSLTATPDHPFFLVKGGERVEKPAAALVEGDRVIVPDAPLADGGPAHSSAAAEGTGPDVQTTAVDSVEPVQSSRVAGDNPKVYDLTVEGTHNFLANGIVVHNSEDRSAMHEALEQQSISISKAGINATLKSRCSLLGAANPKYGRFDQYEPIGEQIELEPALISRFDLIFTVTDQPDEEEDRRLAEHILTTNYAGELNTQREEMTSPDVTREEVEDITEEVDPVISPELLRKYVAYAKQNCHPRMTDEAQTAIREFYTELRAKGTDEDAPVPVTARKLEALVRLAEASARIRLSDRVGGEDAERVIEIVESCLQDVGVDPESGEFDADIVEAGTSKSQRDRIQSIKAIVEEIQDEYEEGAPRQQIIERAEDNGIDQAKAEQEIEKLKERGELYETRTDNFRVV